MVQGLFARSLLRPAPFRRAVEALVPARRFADLPVPLTVCVVDLDTGELLLFGEGGADAPLVDVLCATCALPSTSRRPHARRAALRRRGAPGPAAARGRPRGSRAETVVAVDVGPGFDLAAAGGAPVASPAVVARPRRGGRHPDGRRHRARSSRSGGRTPGRPPLIYVRPRVERNATFRVERVRQYAEDGYRAAREALARWRRP